MTLGATLDQHRTIILCTPDHYIPWILISIKKRRCEQKIKIMSQGGQWRCGAAEATGAATYSCCVNFHRESKLKDDQDF